MCLMHVDIVLLCLYYQCFVWRNHVSHERCYCVARVHVVMYYINALCMVTMYLLYYTASVFCINDMYFLLHYITALLTSFFFWLLLCCCFVVFGRVRLQNHFFIILYQKFQLFTSIFTNCYDYSDIHVAVVCCNVTKFKYVVEHYKCYPIDYGC